MSAKFKENVYLSGSVFHEDTDFTGAMIGGELFLGQPGQYGARWSAGKRLILHNAQAQTIPALSDAWPSNFNIAGFSYRTLRDTAIGHRGSVTKDTPLAAFQAWFEKQDRYAPQAYEQLAAVFQNQGQIENAAMIRYAGKEKSRSELTRMDYLWQTILNWVIGYGYYIKLTILWVIVLVAVGAAVLRLSGQGLKNDMPFGLSYSFDMLLPVIRLRDAHYKVDLIG